MSLHSEGGDAEVMWFGLLEGPDCATSARWGANLEIVCLSPTHLLTFTQLVSFKKKGYQIDDEEGILINLLFVYQFIINAKEMNCRATSWPHSKSCKVETI